MIAFVFLGLIAGLDNLQVAAAMAMTPLARTRRIAFAAACVACEIGSPVVGALAIRSMRGGMPAVAPFVVAACGVAIVWFSLRERDIAPLVNSRWTIVGLPISLSFDNLLLGAGAGAAGVTPLFAALTIGCTSASMSLVGVAAGARIRRWIPEKAEIVSGLYLMTIAATMWIGKE